MSTHFGVFWTSFGIRLIVLVIRNGCSHERDEPKTGRCGCCRSSRYYQAGHLSRIKREEFGSRGQRRWWQKGRKLVCPSVKTVRNLISLRVVKKRNSFSTGKRRKKGDLLSSLNDQNYTLITGSKKKKGQQPFLPPDWGQKKTFFLYGDGQLGSASNFPAAFFWK